VFVLFCAAGDCIEFFPFSLAHGESLGLSRVSVHHKQRELTSGPKLLEEPGLEIPLRLPSVFVGCEIVPLDEVLGTWCFVFICSEGKETGREGGSARPTSARMLGAAQQRASRPGREG
jgi:hypothetical protein